ncbi:methionine--tRNA ligase [Candidatus Woesearchaeota archaeon]|nr:methionine--tRNA ligase [Candidatus Woesearchaeota archaeon]
MAKYYITTAIDYVNAKPHLGHAYEKVIADVLARWQKLKGNDVFFLTGTDDNAQKNVLAAKEAGKEINRFVDENAKCFKELCEIYNVSYNYFIRTTESRHTKVVQSIFLKAHKTGDIYKGKYEGHYCVGCEAFLTEKELVNGKCPEHDKKPEWREEESYFFRLSKYKNKILKLVSSKGFIIPNEKKNEIISRLKSDGLKDLSVSRPTTEWGVKLPIDKSHSVYIWYDALINYISGIDYPEKKFKKYWPADVQIIGKGINWFHSVIWSAMLYSARIKIPKKILVHGYLTIDGKKISKSLGNIIDPIELAKNYPVDAIRYFLIREIPFGQDGDFSEEALVRRLNDELANDMGNLVSRTLSLAEKNFKIVKKQKIELKFELKKIETLVDNFELDKALAEIFKFIQSCNQYINKNKVWELKNKRQEVKIYNLLEALRIISILISPFMPNTSEKINKQLNIKLGNLKDCKFGLIKVYKVKKGEILFKKIEQIEPPKSFVKLKDEISFEDFDFRVAEIKGVKDHPNADKLYILLLDLGKETADDVQIVSGIREHYKKEDLIGKKIILLKNLKEAMIRGIESQGMLLAVHDGKNLSLLIANKSRNGERVFIDLREKAKEVIEIKDFEKLNIVSKNGKIIYNNRFLRTEGEDIKLDKKMREGLRAS